MAHRQVMSNEIKSNGVTLNRRLMFFPSNGCVMRDEKLLVRINYADKETLKVILDAIKAANS